MPLKREIEGYKSTKRHQRKLPERPVDVETWSLSIDGLVKKTLTFPMDNIYGMSIVEVVNTLIFSRFLEMFVLRGLISPKKDLNRVYSIVPI